MRQSDAATHGTLLGGAVHYSQPAAGYRTGIEPVLLAASVPAHGGQTVIEAGCGAGAGLLCLAWRVPGVSGVGIELDPDLAALAARNAHQNGMTQRLTFQAGAIETMPPSLGMFDHAMANPPWHAPGGPASPHPGRDLAKRAAPGLLAAWITALAGHVRPRGSISMILPAWSVDAALGAYRDAGCGSLLVLPLWTRPAQDCRILIVQAVRGGRSATRLHSGLALHEADGHYGELADAILRRGSPLSAAPRRNISVARGAADATAVRGRRPGCRGCADD